MATLPNGYEGPSFGTTGEDRELRRGSEKALVADASKGHLTEERRERVRQQSLAEIPWWYSPWGHLASTTGIGLRS